MLGSVSDCIKLKSEIAQECLACFLRIDAVFTLRKTVISVPWYVWALWFVMADR